MAAWSHWCSLQTQWQHAPMGMGGSRPVGICYAGVTRYLQVHGYRSGRRGRSLRDMLWCMRACEAGALDGFALLQRKGEK